MRFAAAVPAEADYFDERGIYKEYRPTMMQQQIGSMNILRKVHNPNNATILSEDGTETSTSDSGSVPTPDFPFTEFPSTEVVNQSQIDSSSISDTLLPRENTNSSSGSSSKAFRDCQISTEIRAKLLLPRRNTRRNERNRRSSRVFEAFTIYKRSYNYFYCRQF